VYQYSPLIENDLFMSIEMAFANFPILTTERFTLRQLRVTDADALSAIFSDQETMEFDGHPPHASLDDTHGFIQEMLDRYAKRQSFRWGITRPDENSVIGTCSFHYFGPGYHRVETGYDLNRAFWGQGIMTEAMGAVLDFGFHDLALHRIEAVIDDANVRSKKLLLKLGFQYEGNLRQRYQMGDQFADEYYYGLLKEEWLNTPHGSDIR